MIYIYILFNNVSCPCFYKAKKYVCILPKSWKNRVGREFILFLSPRERIYVVTLPFVRPSVTSLWTLYNQRPSMEFDQTWYILSP
jgi:hypothetical protein